MFRKLICLGMVLFALPAVAREFPLCMYGVDDPKDLPLLKKAGFTCIQTYRKQPEQLLPLAQAAQKQKLKLVFYPQKIFDSSYEKQAASWPMLAWYLVDEPDVWSWSRARVQELHQQTKQTWPSHDTTLVIGQGRTRIPFYDMADTMMVDWYPVPHLALTSFGDNVAWTLQGMQKLGAGDRPLWGVVQIFDWKEYKQHRPDDQRIGRFPTQAEIRFMSYDGIVNGATGLFYFIFTTKGGTLPAVKPDLWARVNVVSRELAKLRPVLEKGMLTDNPVPVSAPLVLQMRR